MTESPLLDAIRRENARFEAIKRRKNIITVSVLRNNLPPFVRNQMSMHQLADTVHGMNTDLSAEEIEPTDTKARAAGDNHGL